MPSHPTQRSLWAGLLRTNADQHGALRQAARHHEAEQRHAGGRGNPGGRQAAADRCGYGGHKGEVEHRHTGVLRAELAHTHLGHGRAQRLRWHQPWSQLAAHVQQRCQPQEAMTGNRTWNSAKNTPRYGRCTSLRKPRKDGRDMSVTPAMHRIIAKKVALLVEDMRTVGLCQSEQHASHGMQNTGGRSTRAWRAAL